MSKHTAGPWHSAEKSAKSWNIGVYTEQGDEVAHIAVKSALHGRRREADARLIAAAPYLLVACEAMVEYQRLLDTDTTTGLIEAYGNAFEGAAAKSNGLAAIRRASASRLCP